MANVTADVYERLRARLDEMATGFPHAPSGVEINILKRLFTEEDAELFLQLSPKPASPEALSGRLNREPAELAEHMERMARAGLLFRQRKGDAVRYSTVPYVVGIYEFQLNTVDAELARDMEEYYFSAFGRTLQGFQTPVLRTVPIKREIVHRWPVAPYEDVMTILEDQKTIVLAHCVCRKTANKAGKGCDRTSEACFIFGSHGDYYVENGMGRYVTLEEAKRKVRENDAAGLVMQPFNSQKVGGMCSCCGCCCGILRSLKLQPKPAGAVQSNYQARSDEDLCNGCEICLDRCQMEAIDMKDGIARVNLERCIGCGLCVTTCATEALTLFPKPAEQQYVPPKTGTETYIRIARERGK